MKQGEISSVSVAPGYVEENDPEFKTRHSDFKPDQNLILDVNMKGLCMIQDMYKDKTVFYKSLKKGQGTASPYFDCKVTLRVKIDIDGETKIDQFEVGTVEEAQIEIIAGDSSSYDLEDYTVPAAVRKVLKIQKPYEIMHIKCLKNELLLDHMDDEENGVFKREWFESMQEVCVITIQLLHIE